ncbi:hypothetical protein [Lactobacillus sp. ESL0677]|uniref:hypothetical protein n=1 Tax=Lactobacillus sp. ESL0677 TaxID=2983208 RepID=UPI0023F718B7|nr:hypothetical protein [Lactobacillus sp. ESL0677]WEV36235.1 hypothetical protein OZX76_05670 [Lactobacillus sp. ESL0677]
MTEERRWYVKAFHIADTYYHKWLNSDNLSSSEIINGCIIGRCKDRRLFQFTDSEIEKYHLEDCEKVPANE